MADLESHAHSIPGISLDSLVSSEASSVGAAAQPDANRPALTVGIDFGHGDLTGSALLQSGSSAIHTSSPMMTTAPSTPADIPILPWDASRVQDEWRQRDQVRRRRGPAGMPLPPAVSGSERRALRNFDAFPKADPSVQETSRASGLVSAGLLLCLVLVGLYEWNEYGRVIRTYSYSIDTSTHKDLPLTIDLWMGIACQDVGVLTQDITGETTDISGRFNMESGSFLAPHSGEIFISPESRTADFSRPATLQGSDLSGSVVSFQAAPTSGCRIRGKTFIKKPRAQLIFTSKAILDRSYHDGHHMDDLASLYGIKHTQAQGQGHDRGDDHGGHMAPMMGMGDLHIGRNRARHGHGHGHDHGHGHGQDHGHDHGHAPKAERRHSRREEGDNAEAASRGHRGHGHGGPAANRPIPQASMANEEPLAEATQRHMAASPVNMTHRFNALAFGPRFPDLEAQLDGLMATPPKSQYMYRYFLDVVPTLYWDRTGRLTFSPEEVWPFAAAASQGRPTSMVQSAQFAFNLFHRPVDVHSGNTGFAGIVLSINSEPLRVMISDQYARSMADSWISGLFSSGAGGSGSNLREGGNFDASREAARLMDNLWGMSTSVGERLTASLLDGPLRLLVRLMAIGGGLIYFSQILARVSIHLAGRLAARGGHATGKIHSS
ncbi:hypothetical protein H696_03154 [Fonticula alba]|uniref:Uncharacterized protein n=1 Tax=Fonticula alba TaxID=691883 RepID=A0A058ZA38_FONAL|nr:hypothetical protein H696_03154 [Fonticula alba]KCV70803.1 hypothetical protein H696_03154 [Fonticula alba]|eukprot:XP_009495319.1 hypothetical protein H696_03154 [Fonticula alba]